MTVEVFDTFTTKPSSVYIMTHENVPSVSKIGVAVNPIIKLLLYIFINFLYVLLIDL